MLLKISVIHKAIQKTILSLAKIQLNKVWVNKSFRSNPLIIKKMTQKDSKKLLRHPTNKEILKWQLPQQIKQILKGIETTVQQILKINKAVSQRDSNPNLSIKKVQIPNPLLHAILTTKIINLKDGSNHSFNKYKKRSVSQK